MQLLWNGEALEEFSPSRGIRQGDPLSPYLFVIFLERLFHLIDIEVRLKTWSPIMLTRRCPDISHLAFADDLLLFADATVNQARIIKQVLHTFCSSSRQKVSLDKTRIYYSNNVPYHLRVDIRECLGF